MKRLITFCTIFLMSVTGVLSTPVICHAQETNQESTQTEDKSAQIAGEDERAEAVAVGEDGMVPVSGRDVKDGIYDVAVDSSSSMFRIVEAQLTVENGEMTAVITLGGTGYLKLFMGTGEQAVEADESEYASYVEDVDGAYTYEVSVEALDQVLECTGFSKKKEKWYDHQILFRADSLPEDALLIDLPDYGQADAKTGDGATSSEVNEDGVMVIVNSTSSNISDAKAVPAEIDLKDGTYTIEVELSGGSGKASITSPAVLTVKDKTAVATIEWSSPNYDYMLVDGEKFLPVNTEGNSVFEIPVTAFDQEMQVTADTTAMSTPHEIEYTLLFKTDTIQGENQNGAGNHAAAVVIVIVVTAAVVIAAVTAGVKKKRKNTAA